MRTSAWVPAVLLSLLYHAVLLTLVAKALSADNSKPRAIQAITVQLLQPAPVPEPRPPTPVSKPKPPIPATPVPRAAKPKPRTMGLETSKTTTPTPPQESALAAADTQEPMADMQEPTADVQEPTADVQARAPALESNPPALNIQPLHRLTRPPAFLRQIEAVYPISERRAGVQANVLAEVTIDSQGRVLHVRIVKSGGAQFDKAVLEALSKSAFVPGYIGALPVAVRFQIPFRFNLN
jgi:TonB family protein